MKPNFFRTILVVLPFVTSTIFAGIVTEFKEAEHTSGAAGIVWNGWNIGSCDNGDWAAYSQINLREGTTAFRARIASGNPTGSHPGNIEIRLDAVDGQLIGTHNVAGTGSWSNWEIQESSMNGGSGVHDIYLVFVGVEQYHGICDIDWFEIDTQDEPAPPPSPVVIEIEGEDYDDEQGTRLVSNPTAVGYIDNGNWLKYNAVDFQNGALQFTGTLGKAGTAGQSTGGTVEIRIDALDGELLGELNVVATGGWYIYEEQSVDLSGSGSGVHDLFLVFHGGWGICNVDKFEIIVSSLDITVEEVTVDNPDAPNNFPIFTDGSITAWRGGLARGSNAWDIYMFDGQTVEQITSTYTYMDLIGVEDGMIVWHDPNGYKARINGNIVPVPGADKLLPNNIILYYNNETGYEGIYRYQNGSSQLLTADGTENFDATSSHVVYAKWDGNDNEIYLFDGSSTYQLTNNAINDVSVAIDGNTVAWIGGDNVYRYTITTGVTNQITTDNVQRSNLVVSGNNVAWSNNDEDGHDIYLSTPSGVTLIAENQRSDMFNGIELNIDDDKLVWKTGVYAESIPCKIYYYTGSETVVVYDGTGEYSLHTIDFAGNKIVWTHQDYGFRVTVATINE